MDMYTARCVHFVGRGSTGGRAGWRIQNSMRSAFPLSTDTRILSPALTSLNCNARCKGTSGRAIFLDWTHVAAEMTHRQLSGAVQALYFVHPVPDVVEQLVES